MEILQYIHIRYKVQQYLHFFVLKHNKKKEKQKNDMIITDLGEKTMTLQELLEKDKERFIQSIIQAETADRAVEEVQREFSRLLFAYNEQETSEKLKASAYQMMETAKSAATLVDSDGSTKIYEQKEYSSQKEPAKRSKWFYVYLIISLCCIVAACVICFMNANLLKILLNMPIVLILMAVGLLGVFLAGTKMKKVASNGADLFTRTAVDPEKIYHSIFVTVVQIDKLLNDIRDEEVLAKKAQMKETNGGLSQNDIEFLASLLEDAYADKNNAYAQEIISHVRYYLHKKEIQTIDYSEKNRSWFDKMPAKETSTLRPAIVLDGKLLKKGLAAGGR